MAKVSFQKLWRDIMEEEIFVDDVIRFKDEFNDFAAKVVSGNINPNDPELEAFIRVCNDVYTYHPSGEVMIPDSLYDQCMNIFKSGGNATIVHASAIGKKKWNFIKHVIPGIVGTLDKIYTYQELKEYLRKYHGVNKFILAPKYDGISCSIHVENGEIISAATRYDGLNGQDITELVKRAKNARTFMSPDLTGGFYKCELCISTDSFERLKEVKRYANRRSATSGIINTPTNLGLANFVTIVPLLFYNDNLREMHYIAPYKKEVQFFTPADLMEDIEVMLENIRSQKFPFRVDGVIINPDPRVIGRPNELDLMENSIAFKVNTAEGKTKIRYGYMSIGRLGKGMPMLKVEPVEVNETIVEDVSLGSYDKFLSMELREGEDVIVYSAGDVIPQIKLPTMRTNFYNSPELKIKRVCPHCGVKLTRVSTEYYCMNEECPRIISGRISNFLEKMGIEGFSDRSVEMIYNALGVDSINKFLKLTVEDIMKVDGFEEVSARNLVNELNRLKTTPVSIPKFFGSLGIEKISEKKCRKIFEYVTVDELLHKKDLDRIYWELQSSDGIGPKTARVFVDFIKENRKSIEKIMAQLNLGNDIKYKGNVVFTGYRPDKETEDRFRALGIEIGNSVTKSTVGVVTATYERDSVKSKAAIAKGIPVYHASNIEDLFYDIKKNLK